MGVVVQKNDGRTVRETLCSIMILPSDPTETVNHFGPKSKTLLRLIL